MKYEILDANGNVANTVISSPDFMEQYYPGSYRLVEETPVAIPPVLTKYEFLKRFTAQERIAARALAKTNDAIFDFMDLLSHASEVDCGNSDTIAAVQALEVLGALGDGRAVEILGG